VTRILVIEDDPSIRMGLEDTLTAKGYQVEVVGKGGEGAEKAMSGRYDLVVLDVMLPDIDGFEVCRRIRQSRGPTRRLPVIMLSARGAELDRVRGLELGADDYVTKPFSPRELAARVTSVLHRHRSHPDGGGTLEFPNLRIDPLAREVHVDGRLVDLRPKEFDLLLALAQRPRQVFTRRQLLDLVWDSAPEYQDPATVTVHVGRLRAKLEPDPESPRWIRTARGVGYRFEP